MNILKSNRTETILANMILGAYVITGAAIIWAMMVVIAIVG